LIAARKEQSAISGLLASAHRHSILHAANQFFDNGGDQHLFSGKFVLKGEKLLKISFTG